MWFPKKHRIPPEAIQARAHAVNQNYLAREQLSMAKSMASSLAAMRERNHFAEAIQAASRKAQA